MIDNRNTTNGGIPLGATVVFSFAMLWSPIAGASVGVPESGVECCVNALHLRLALDEEMIAAVLTGPAEFGERAAGNETVVLPVAPTGQSQLPPEPKAEKVSGLTTAGFALVVPGAFFLAVGLGMFAVVGSESNSNGFVRAGGLFTALIGAVLTIPGAFVLRAGLKEDAKPERETDVSIPIRPGSVTGRNALVSWRLAF